MTKWISVPLPPDMAGRHGGAAYSTTRNDEILKWLEEQWEAGAIKKWINYKNHAFGFSRAEDAMAFKLRWL